VKVLIIGNSFPNTKQVFIHNKIIGLAAAGVEIFNLSSKIGSKAHLRAINRQLKGRIEIFSYDSNSEFIVSVMTGMFFFFTDLKKLLQHCLSERPLKVGLMLFKRNLSLVAHARKVDVVHFEWNNQASGFVDAIRFIRKPFIVSIRGRGITSQPQSDSELRSRLAVVFREATIIHSISSDLVTYLELYPFNKSSIRIIHPAIDLAKVREKERQRWPEIRIITVAHYRWKKNLANAILVISKLIKDGFNLTYELIGEGPDREQLQFVISDLKMTDRILLHGYKSHEWVLERLAQTDIFLMPSIQEGFCNAVIEAQATGLPCVVTNAEGLAENVEHGVTGFVVDKFDTDSMLCALKDFILHEDIRVKFGTAGRERAFSKFDIRIQVTQFMEIYKEAVNLHVQIK
jgi:colanic acid/amylovoran biosynthesis glycosyltransferase